MAMAGTVVRLSFPRGEHQDVLVPPGETTIGSADGNGIVLKTGAVQPHHLSIVVDQRGMTLEVASPEAWTHVNARPVREKAILNLGDVVSVDSVNIVIKPDSDEVVTQHVPPPPGGAPMEDADDSGDTRYRAVPPRAVLRGVSGPYFGKVVAIPGRLVIGRGSDCDLVLDEPEMSRRHAMIEVQSGELFLRDLGSANGTFVNGVQVRDAVLYSGDQLAFDRNRFLIEAPGMPTRRDEVRQPTPTPVPPPGALGAGEGRAPMVTQTMRAVRADDAPAASSTTQSAGGSWNPWWLIGTGALIAVIMAALFLLKFN